MLSFWEFLVEATLAARLKSSRATVRPKPRAVKAASGRSYPWTVAHTGWWHPVKSPLLFAWLGRLGRLGRGNYHITQVYKSPQHFGLTKKRIMDELGSLSVMPDYAKEAAYAEYLDGKRDLDERLERFLHKDGWLRTRTVLASGTPSVTVAGHPPAMRLAAAQVAVHAYAAWERNARVMFTAEDMSRHSQSSVTFDDPEDIEHYAKG